jgi:4-amino-4-deoxy-L-arabinose transferase-like glycosyltransferase
MFSFIWLFIKRKVKETLLFIVVIVLLIPIYYKLGYENINVDQFLWYQRSENFFQAIANKDYASTYQQYHPGVTLMYLIGLGQLTYKLVTKDLSPYASISYQNFGLYSFYTKLYLVTFCLLLLFLSAHLVRKISASKIISLTFLVLLLLESYYIGILRNLHMDGILSVLLFSTVLSFYVACDTKSSKYMFLSGILLGLGFLTKSTSFFAGLYCGLIFLFFFIKYKDKRLWLFKMSVVWVALSIFIFFVLFPAMWVKPLDTINKIVFSGAVEEGVSGSFSHFVNNKSTEDPGLIFYPQVLKYRLTPIMQFLITFLVIYIIYIYISRDRDKPWPIILFSILFILIYLAVFMLVKKKTDRYLSPLFPFLALLGSYSIYRLKELFSKKKILNFFYYVLFIGGACYYIWNTVTITPYFFAYYNHLWGGISKARYEIYLNQAGIGAFDIATYLNDMNLPEGTVIGATNERELQKALKYKVIGLYPAQRKDYDFVIVALQNDGTFKKGRVTTKVFNIQNQNYWKIYTNP